MTDRIQNIIEEIRSKKDGLSNLLKIEQEKVIDASKKNAKLEEQLVEKQSNVHALTAQIDNLSKDLTLAQQEIQALKQQLNASVTEVVTVPSRMENVQIDELVREIEYCIGQLKNNA